MFRVAREIVNEILISNDTNEVVIIPTLLIDNNTNSSLISAYSSSQKSSWEFNWNLIILLVLGFIFVISLLSVGIWYWCHRVYRLRRQHSLPLAINDFIDTTKIQEKRLSSSPKIIKPPPVPPRPTAYTTILGKVEYRSNL